MGIFESIRIINNFKPDLVMGVGSYAAGPVAIGAWFMRKKIVLHEQNILPGITNRILSRFSDRIYVSFKNTKANFNSKKVLYTGEVITSANYLLTQFRVIVTYIRLLFLPIKQNLFYHYPISTTLLEPRTFVCFVFLSTLIFTALKILRKHILISFSIFYFPNFLIASTVTSFRDIPALLLLSKQRNVV